MKTGERMLARAMRRNEGRSIKEIARLVGVSQGTVSLWGRDIELTPEQHEALHDRNPAYSSQLRGRLIWADICRERRQEWQAEGREMTKRGEVLHAAGCMLYWAEGGKKRNVAYMSNADPEVLRFFVRFVRAYFDVEAQDFRVRATYLPITSPARTRSSTSGYEHSAFRNRRSASRS